MALSRKKIAENLLLLRAAGGKDGGAFRHLRWPYSMAKTAASNNNNTFLPFGGGRTAAAVASLSSIPLRHHPETAHSCRRHALPVSSTSSALGRLFGLGPTSGRITALTAASIPHHPQDHHQLLQYYHHPSRAAAAATMSTAAAGDPAASPLDPKKLRKQLAFATRRNPIPASDLDELGFCNFFTDHMMEVDWDRRTGWGPPLIRQTGSITIPPGSTGLHYGVQAFDGVKCFAASSGGGELLLFRPDRHIHRLFVSSQRLTLPFFDEATLLELIRELVRTDRQWVPNKDGYSMYVRPVLFSTQPTLGVAPPGAAKLYMTLSPCGPYFPSGFKPVQIRMETVFNRAFPGGVGDCKVGGNYAPSLLPQMKAAKDGFAQVLWLFPDGDDYQMTEVGCMNFFLFWINEKGEKELITAPLGDNLILPGITRDSVLELARQDGSYKVSEKVIYVKKDFLKAHAEGRILEAFGSGTAAVLAPIDLLQFQGKNYQVPLDKDDPSASLGPLCKKLIHQIYDIQYGRTPHHWAVRV